MRATQQTKTRGFIIDLGPDVTGGRYLVAKDFSPTSTVMDVLEGRSGTILYRGDNHDEAERVMTGGAR